MVSTAGCHWVRGAVLPGESWAGELGRTSGTAPKKKGGEPRPQETGKRGGRNKQCCPEEARKRGGGKQRKKDKKFLSVNFPFSEQGISW